MARAWTVAVAVVCVAGFATAAPVPVKADDSPVAKARRTLDQKITLSAENKSLAEIVEMLKEETKADLTLDTATLQQFGVDVNTPVVKCEVKDVKVRDALKIALAQYNLLCGPTATGLVISTEEGLLGKQLRHRVDVDAADRPLGDLLKTLADQSGANVVFDSRPGKKLTDAPVTLKADDVPVETAIRLAAEIGGYGVVRMGNVLFVTTADRADKLNATADRPIGPANPNPVVPGVSFEGPGVPLLPRGAAPVVDPIPPPGEPVVPAPAEPKK